MKFLYPFYLKRFISAKSSLVIIILLLIISFIISAVSFAKLAAGQTMMLSLSMLLICLVGMVFIIWTGIWIFSNFIYQDAELGLTNLQKRFGRKIINIYWAKVLAQQTVVTIYVIIVYLFCLITASFYPINFQGFLINKFSLNAFSIMAFNFIFNGLVIFFTCITKTKVSLIILWFIAIFYLFSPVIGTLPITFINQNSLQTNPITYHSNDEAIKFRTDNPFVQYFGQEYDNFHQLLLNNQFYTVSSSLPDSMQQKYQNNLNTFLVNTMLLPDFEDIWNHQEPKFQVAILPSAKDNKFYQFITILTSLFKQDQIGDYKDSFYYKNTINNFAAHNQLNDTFDYLQNPVVITKINSILKNEKLGIEFQTTDFINLAKYTREYYNTNLLVNPDGNNYFTSFLGIFGGDKFYWYNLNHNKFRHTPYALQFIYRLLLVTYQSKQLTNLVMANNNIFQIISYVYPMNSMALMELFSYPEDLVFDHHLNEAIRLFPNFQSIKINQDRQGHPIVIYVSRPFKIGYLYLESIIIFVIIIILGMAGYWKRNNI